MSHKKIILCLCIADLFFGRIFNTTPQQNSQENQRHPTKLDLGLSVEQNKLLMLAQTKPACEIVDLFIRNSEADQDCIATTSILQTVLYKVSIIYKNKVEHSSAFDSIKESLEKAIAKNPLIFQKQPTLLAISALLFPEATADNLQRNYQSLLSLKILFASAGYARNRHLFIYGTKDRDDLYHQFLEFNPRIIVAIKAVELEKAIYHYSKSENLTQQDKEILAKDYASLHNDFLKELVKKLEHKSYTEFFLQPKELLKSDPGMRYADRRTIEIHSKEPNLLMLFDWGEALTQAHLANQLKKRLDLAEQIKIQIEQQKQIEMPAEQRPEDKSRTFAGLNQERGLK